MTPEPRLQRRRWLWLLLVSLVVALLVMLVWLASRYEASQVQDRLEHDNGDAVSDIRTAFTHNVQSLQALQFSDPSPGAWAVDAAEFLRSHRELVRVEWRDATLRLKSTVDTPFRAPVFVRLGRENSQSDVAHGSMMAGDERLLVGALSSAVLATLALLDSIPHPRLVVSASAEGRRITFAITQNQVAPPSSWRARAFDPQWTDRAGGVPALVAMLAVQETARVHGGTALVDPLDNRQKVGGGYRFHREGSNERVDLLRHRRLNLADLPLWPRA